tara:strand:+ start:729 stop:1010 length:282 start_codon:yes stop_codon:yes gene_type:complete
MQNETLNDELQIRISVKWAVQLIVFVISLTSAWFTLRGQIDTNAKDIVQIHKALIEFEENLDTRIEPLEAEREARLQKLNQSLFDRVIGKKEE